MDFTDLIKKSKPNISESSSKTYNSLLRSIYTNVFGKTDEPNVKNFTIVNIMLQYFIRELHLYDHKNHTTMINRITTL